MHNFSLRSSAKEQFSVPVKASQEHTVRKTAGKASNYTSPSSFVSHILSYFSCLNEVYTRIATDLEKARITGPTATALQTSWKFFLIFSHFSGMFHIDMSYAS